MATQIDSHNTHGQDAEPHDRKNSDTTVVGNNENADLEKVTRVIPENASHADSDDPFGDETNAEVKYRVMAWWLVTTIPNTRSSTTQTNLLDRRQAGMSTSV